MAPEHRLLQFRDNCDYPLLGNPHINKGDRLDTAFLSASLRFKQIVRLYRLLSIGYELLQLPDTPFYSIFSESILFGMAGSY